MKKLIKWIVGLGTVGTAIGLLAVRLIKKSKSTSSVSLQAAQPDDLTEKSNVDNADSSEVETQPAVSDESDDTIAENE